MYDVYSLFITTKRTLKEIHISLYDTNTLITGDRIPWTWVAKKSHYIHEMEQQKSHYTHVSLPVGNTRPEMNRTSRGVSPNIISLLLVLSTIKKWLNRNENVLLSYYKTSCDNNPTTLLEVNYSISLVAYACTWLKSDNDIGSAIICVINRTMHTWYFTWIDS